MKKACIMLLLWHVVAGASYAQEILGDQGWAAITQGGAEGVVIPITNLNAKGPGSFSEAINTPGPRTVIFKVGGIIDLNRTSISINEPYLTVAGETAPSPGITLIRGGINIRAHDVILRHIRVRPGEAGFAKRGGWEVDGIATSSYNIIVDHCSCTWATDENLSAGGPRFSGDTVDEWRANTSHRVTFSNCLIAEGLSHSTHSKGEHSKGSLIHDNATDIAIIGNLYVSNRQRNPYFKGGTQGIVVNNYIFNPGDRPIHYTLHQSEWINHPFVTGQMAVVGNVMEHGLDTMPGLPLFAFWGEGPLQIYLHDNEVRDRKGNSLPSIVSTDPNCMQIGNNRLCCWPCHHA